MRVSAAAPRGARCHSVKVSAETVCVPIDGFDGRAPVQAVAGGRRVPSDEQLTRELRRGDPPQRAGSREEESDLGGIVNLQRIEG